MENTYCPMRMAANDFYLLQKCKKEECSWYDINNSCCCIKTIATNMDDLVKGQRIVYTKEV